MGLTHPNGAYFWHLVQSTVPPRYSVAITAVSGLDPAAPADTPLQGGGLFNPAFNLTVAIASRSTLRGACIGPGTAIRVS
ncbi:hypothetical protein ACP4OV_006242 [Aristida adscensionis]